MSIVSCEVLSSHAFYLTLAYMAVRISKRSTRAFFVSSPAKIYEEFRLAGVFRGMRSSGKTSYYLKINLGG